MKDPKDPLHSGVGWEQLHGKEIPFVGRKGNDCLSYRCCSLACMFWPRYCSGLEARLLPCVCGQGIEARTGAIMAQADNFTADTRFCSWSWCWRTWLGKTPSDGGGPNPVLVPWWDRVAASPEQEAFGSLPAEDGSGSVLMQKAAQN